MIKTDSLVRRRSLLRSEDATRQKKVAPSGGFDLRCPTFELFRSYADLYLLGLCFRLLLNPHLKHPIVEGGFDGIGIDRSRKCERPGESPVIAFLVQPIAF